MKAVTHLVVCLCSLMLSACAGLPEQPPADNTAQLTDGELLFGNTIEPVPTIDLLHVSPAMHAFVDADVTGSRFGYVRFRRLLDKMAEKNFFDNPYDMAATFTASEAFDARRGNCLAYTNLFIALAREAGLQAHYQLVDTKPTWNVESGYLVKNNHINVLVQKVNLPNSPGAELTVDFNLVDPDPEAPGDRISDSYATSLYFTNIAIDHLHEGELRSAFANLKRALILEPKNKDAWNNLAVLYSIENKYDAALRTHRVALQLDPRDKTAIGGIAKALVSLNRTDEAQRYTDLAKRYQERNPFYHYALAHQAFSSEAYDEALGSINQAIRLRRTNTRFYVLRAKTALALGDQELLDESLRLIRKHAGRKPSPRASRGPTTHATTLSFN
jgi:tetratricopeptide (TPR) repeat protein